MFFFQKGWYWNELFENSLIEFNQTSFRDLQSYISLFMFIFEKLVILLVNIG